MLFPIFFQFIMYIYIFNFGGFFFFFWLKMMHANTCILYINFFAKLTFTPFYSYIHFYSTLLVFLTVQTNLLYIFLIWGSNCKLFTEISTLLFFYYAVTQNYLNFKNVLRISIILEINS